MQTSSKVSSRVTTARGISPASPKPVRCLVAPFPSFAFAHLSVVFRLRATAAFFNEALAAGGQLDPSKLYFVDDSALNIKGAHALKWGNCVLFDEHGDEQEKLGGLDKLDSVDGKVSVVGDVLGELRGSRICGRGVGETTRDRT